MSATGELAHEATVFYKRLASLLSAKWGDEYSVVLGWLRCCLGFSLLRSAIQCIRGARSSIGAYTRAPPPMDLVQVESHLSEQHAGCVTLLFLLSFTVVQHVPLCWGW